MNLKYELLLIKENSLDKCGKEYDRPLSLMDIKKTYGESIYNKLKSDPIHSWRANMGIELIHQEPTIEELERIWDNWNRMDKDLQDISDRKSIELFGMTNKEHYYKLKHEKRV